MQEGGLNSCHAGMLCTSGGVMQFPVSDKCFIALGYY